MLAASSQSYLHHAPGPVSIPCHAVSVSEAEVLGKFQGSEFVHIPDSL